MEKANPQLEQDIRDLFDPESQADRQLRNTFAYTRLTASAVRQKLMDEKGWRDEALPQVRTISNIPANPGQAIPSDPQHA
ncbi:MAG: hypothetical protein R3E95_01420 [Thiolinea sp.]